MNLQEVIQKNRALAKRARDLNIRAGRRIFSVPGQNQLREFFLASLSGARRVQEITQFDTLLLPPLDESLVATILDECPDTIVVLGQKIVVEYEDEYGGVRSNPRVKLPSEMTARHAWLNLPDGGIFLPNGRQVAVVFSPKYDDWVGDTDIMVLKEKARECLNKELWTRWHQPEIVAPIEVIAPIKEQEYGRCKVTNQPLIAFGTVKRTWSSWATHWTRDRAEALRVNEDARRQFTEVKVQMRCDVLRRHIADLYNLHRTLVSDTLRDRMYNVAYYTRSPQSISDMEALIAEVEEVLKPKKVETGLFNIDVSKLFGGTARNARDYNKK